MLFSRGSAGEDNQAAATQFARDSRRSPRPPRALAQQFPTLALTDGRGFPQKWPKLRPSGEDKSSTSRVSGCSPNDSDPRRPRTSSSSSPVDSESPEDEGNTVPSCDVGRSRRRDCLEYVPFRVRVRTEGRGSRESDRKSVV